MGETTRRKFTPPRVQGQGCLRGAKRNVNQGRLGEKYEIAPEMISRWKNEFVENANMAFGAKTEASDFGVP